MKHLFIALCILHTICTLHAQPGDLDIQFDNDGVLVSQGTPGQDVAYSVAAHPDGDIVAVGSFLYGYEYFGVVKYSPVGEERWRKIYGLGPQSRCLADQVLIQSTGKILAVGYMNPGQSSMYRFAAVRYLADGTIDPSFDGDGILLFNLPDSNSDLCLAAALQPDDYLLMAGSSQPTGATRQRFAIARFTPQGVPDSTFGASGVITTVFPNQNAAIKHITVQADGRILAAGVVGSQLVIARYLPNGLPDGSFGFGGQIKPGISLGTADQQTILYQPDGRIIWTGGTASNDIEIIRFLPDGNLDLGFGHVMFANNGIDKANGAVLQPDGKILVTGYSDGSGKNAIRLLRFGPSGQLDTTFHNGTVETNVSGINDIAHDIALQPDGKILVAAGTYMSNSSEFTLLRYLSGLTSSTHDTEKPFGNIHVNPNPAVSYVELHYNLPSADKTTIRLYDALGKHIKTIVGHEYRLSGPHVEQILLHDGLSPGTYSITIETAKGLRQATQLVVMR